MKHEWWTMMIAIIKRKNNLIKAEIRSKSNVRSKFNWIYQPLRLNPVFEFHPYPPSGKILVLYPWLYHCMTVKGIEHDNSHTDFKCFKLYFLVCFYCKSCAYAWLWCVILGKRCILNFQISITWHSPVKE